LIDGLSAASVSNNFQLEICAIPVGMNGPKIPISRQPLFAIPQSRRFSFYSTKSSLSSLPTFLMDDMRQTFGTSKARPPHLDGAALPSASLVRGPSLHQQASAVMTVAKDVATMADNNDQCLSFSSQQHFRQESLLGVGASFADLIARRSAVSNGTFSVGLPTRQEMSTTSRFVHASSLILSPGDQQTERN
jgi:hypothetical protein